MKASRWYEECEGAIMIYDAPYPEHSKTVSIVTRSDLRYYRNNFNLKKVWK